MARLSLQVDVVDDSDPSQQGYPVAYTVLGFTCGSMAQVTRHPTLALMWLVHVAPPGEPLARVGRVFSDPFAALLFVESWLDALDAPSFFNVAEGPATGEHARLTGDRMFRRGAGV
jgi:hypothetical protein